jgi:hypothetical protein
LGDFIRGTISTTLIIIIIILQAIRRLCVIIFEFFLLKKKVLEIKYTNLIVVLRILFFSFNLALNKQKDFKFYVNVMPIKK